MRRVAIDFDGVVMDLLNAVKAFLPDFKPENVEAYNFDGDIGVNKSDVYALFQRKDFYESLQPYPRAIEAIQRLLTAQDIQASAWTSVSNIDSLEVREKQIESTGIMRHYIYVGEKVPLRSFDILIEDCWETALAEAEYGRVVYLIDQTYNRCGSHERIVRCEDLWDAVERIVNEEPL